MTPSLSEPFCFPESSETPYSVVTNGSVIHPLSLNYRFQFFWPHFAQAYGSICTPYNSTPQFTSGIYYNGLDGVSSLTPAALSKDTRGETKEQCNLAHPQFLQISLVSFFPSVTLLSVQLSLPTPISLFSLLCACFPFVINLIFMGLTLLAQTTRYLP